MVHGVAEEPVIAAVVVDIEDAFHEAVIPKERCTFTEI